MSNVWTFDNTENRYSLYHEEDCLKKFCIYLREHAADVINFDKTKVQPLTEKKAKITSSENHITVSYICRKKFVQKIEKDENQQKVKDHGHITGNAHSTCNLRFIVPNKIPAVFHKESNYDYHFIMKELANS